MALSCGAFSCVFALVTIVSARRFFSSRARGALSPLPPITLIKPLKGADDALYDNLLSFCRQDYPCFQIIFCLTTPEDPALAVVARLKREFPQTDIEVVVSNHRIGCNPKVNNMANAYPFVKHDFLLMSDSDIRVCPDFLQSMVAPFADPSVGLVTSFYQASGARGLWGHMESLSINAQFLPSAACAAGFGMRFAMGAAMMVRRRVFELTGGFQNLANHLADDFWLGESVRSTGGRIEIASGCVETIPDITAAREHFKHLVRWARTIRLCSPGGFYASLCSHGFSLLLLRLLISGPDAAGITLLALLWAAKAAASVAINERLGRRQRRRALWLLPLSECFSFAAWVLACISNKVLWRGSFFTVESSGRLSPATPL